MTLEPKEALYLCMGSACHHRGVYDVLPIFRDLLTRCRLDDLVELKGSFCLGPCTQAICATYKDYSFTHITPKDAADIFMKQILPIILDDLPRHEHE